MPGVITRLHFKVFRIKLVQPTLLVFRQSGTLALRTERQSARSVRKIIKGGLDQYGAERFGRLIFTTIRKSVGLKRLTDSHDSNIRDCYFCRTL